MLAKEVVERPWYWQMVPSHGNHAGPNRSSNDVPVSDTDAVAQLHDKCYGNAQSRDDELGCDAQAYHYAQNAVADGPYEAMYLGAMKQAFHPDRTGKSAPEDAPGFSNALIEYVPLPQRIPRNRRVEQIKKEEVKIEKAIENIEAIAPGVGPPKNQSRAIRERVKHKRAAVPKRQRNSTAAKKLKRERRKLRRKKKALKKKQGPRMKGGAFRSKQKPKAKKGKKFGGVTAVRSGGNDFVGSAIVEKNLAGRPWSVNRFAHKKAKHNDGIVIKSTDFLTKITNAVGSPQADNMILLTQLLNPLAFTNTRMAQFAPLYECFRFRRIAFLWAPAPAGGTTSGGAYMHYVDEDPMTDYTPANGAQRLISIMACHQGCHEFQVFKPDASVFRHDTPEATYYLKANASPLGGATPSNDSRDINQGKYHLAIVNAPPAGAVGNIWVEYEIEFWHNALAQDLLTSNAALMGGALDNDVALEWTTIIGASSDSIPITSTTTVSALWHMDPAISGATNLSPNAGAAEGVKGVLAIGAAPTNSAILTVTGMASKTVVITVTGKINSFGSTSTPVVAGNNVFNALGGIPTNCTQQVDTATDGVRINGSNLYWTGRAKFDITDVSLPFSIPINGNMLTSGSMTNGVGSTGFCSVRVSTDVPFVQQPFMAKCPYSQAIKNKPNDTVRIMSLWTPEAACEKATCKACGFARISSAFRDQLHHADKIKFKEKEKIKFTRIENASEESDSSDDEQEKRKEKRKSLPAKGSC